MTRKQYSMKSFLEICMWVATKTRSTMGEMRLERALEMQDPYLGGENSQVIESTLKLQDLFGEGKPVPSILDFMAYISMLNARPLMQSLYTMYMAASGDTDGPAGLPSIMEFLQMEWTDVGH